MRRRRLILALVAAALLAVAGGVVWTVFRPRPYIIVEQVQRIQKGMTLEEVVATLGLPPGVPSDVSDGVLAVVGLGTAAVPPEEDTPVEWFADYEPPHDDGLGHFRHHGLGLTVRFNAQGRVTGWFAATTAYLPLTASDRFQLWLSTTAAKLGV
jgi:hypothetical protein